MNPTILATGAVLLFAAACADPQLSSAHFHPRGELGLSPAPGVFPAFTERVYVPVYSSIYWGSGEMITDLSATLSIRNTDPERAILLLSVDYYDSRGERVRRYLSEASRLAPMGTLEFVIERTDAAGGAGANFLVEWGAADRAYEPVMESVMLGQIGSAGISFVSQGRPLRERGPTSASEQE